MSIFSEVGKLFGGGGHQPNPADKAMPYLNQIPGKTQPYYQPYQEAGKTSLSDLQKRYSQLLNNPTEIYDKLGEGYQQSPGYAATLREALASANNAAAMGGGGGLGSYGHQQLAATAAGDVANKDYEQYINHMLGLYGGGLSGEQAIENQGYGANTDYAQLLANLLGTQGQYKFLGQNAKNQASAQSNSNLFNALGAIGGGIFGGPIGASLGGWLGNTLGNPTQ